MPKTPGRATIGTRRHARVAWGALCAFLSDYAALSVPTRCDQEMDPEYYVEVARRYKLLGQAAQFYAVAIARREGRTWDQVARACRLPDADSARVIYEAKYEAFVRGERNPWTIPGMRGVIPDGVLDDPDAEAARLDEWCVARGLAEAPDLHPVTHGLY